MRVVPITTLRGPASTVVGSDDLPVPEIDHFLGYLGDLKRAPNTVRAYAYDLRDFFQFCEDGGLSWSAVKAEDIASFITWLQMPEPLRAVRVLPLQVATAAVTDRTVNRKLSAVSSFYRYHLGRGVDLPWMKHLLGEGVKGRADWHGGLHREGSSRRPRQGALRLKESTRVVRALGQDEMDAVVRGATCRRDRLLLQLLADYGLRAGEVLGLRHQDIFAAECEVHIVPRANRNGARAKSGHRRIPVSPQLVRLYAEYLAHDYGASESEYVFLSKREDAPLTYWGLHKAIQRIAERAQVEFTAHTLRHTCATRLARARVGGEVIAQLLGHKSIDTTAIYTHLTTGDLRNILEKAKVS